MEKFYQTMLAYIYQRPALSKIILTIMKYYPYFMFCLYPCILFYLYISKNPAFFEAIWKPLGAFLTVTIFRKLCNRPRPYESMDIVPLITHKSGESFPSRHTLSSVIIALVSFYIHTSLGIFTLTGALIMSVCRILAGVHYISDVAVSIIIALLFYLI